MEKVLQLIEENRKTKAPFLDLGNLGLTELPDELWTLTHLQRLNLGSSYFDDANYKESENQGVKNRIVNIPDKIKRLTKLNSIDFSGNDIKDYNFLKELPQLTSLHLRINKNQDYSFLLELKKLRSLKIPASHLKDYNFLGNLTQLTSLDLRFCFFIRDYSFLGNLTQLTSLNLSSIRGKNIHILGNLKQLTSLSMSLSSLGSISNVNFLRSLTKLTKLKVTSGKISDINFLKELKQLTYLNLHGNNINDCSSLGGLTKLTRLTLSANQIEDISFLKQLKQLTSLNLRKNNLKDCSLLEDLNKLTGLDLSNNSKIHNYNFLRKLKQLTSLELGGNNIKDCSFLEELNKLCTLNLTGNIWIKDYSFLAKLPQLISLSLNFNQIRDISPLQELKQLTSLDLNFNQIRDISPLQELKQLTSLDLNFNQIRDISPLRELKQLTSLDLSFNQIGDISILKELTLLTSLDLNSNLITRFPKFLLSFKNFHSLKLSQNPIQDFPVELISENNKNCWLDIQSWFFDLEKGKIENQELKLIIIGNGRVGKSCIADRLLGKEFDQDKESTHAINVEEWHPKGKINSLRVNIWDFGGQDIYHGTHRIFLQSRALYLIIWDARNEEEKEIVFKGEKFKNHKLSYWLDYVDTLGKESPIIIVQNKIDRDGELSLVDYFETDYNIKFSRAVSAKTGGIELEHLKENIVETMTQMREYRQEMPLNWHRVREKVKQFSKKKKAIEYEEYLSICTTIGIEKTAPSLLKFLHNTGVVYYQEGLFDNQIILDQKWAIEAVYSLLNWQEDPFQNIEQGEGWFDLRVLAKLWKDYSKKERNVILSYMENCELCFKINDSIINPQFIIPQFLPDSPEGIVQDLWKNRYQDALHLVYEIPFLHEALIHRFIVRVGRLAIPRGLWSKGICIKYYKSYALIETGKEKDIHIWVDGPERKILLDQIRNTFQKLIDEQDQVEILIGVGQGDLVELKEAKAYSSQEKVKARDSLNFVEIKLLQEFFFINEERKLEEIVPEPPTKLAAKLYLSWSEADEDKALKEDFTKYLVTLKHQGKLEIWDRTQIGPGQLVDLSKEEAWEKADFYALLLSPDYLNNMTSYEEMEALCKLASEKETQIIPILGRECLIDGSIIEQFQLLPRNKISVSSQENMAKTWVDIAKEIQTILKEMGW